MRIRAQSRVARLVIFVLLISPRLLLAQANVCVDHSSVASHKSAGIKINIVGVEFTGQNSVSDELRSRIADTVRNFEISASPNDPDTYWPNVLRAATVIKILQARGYFTASTQLTPYLVKAESDQRSYIASIAIETGPVYHVKAIHVRDATVFSPTDLEEQISVKAGDVMNQDKILQGLDSIKRLYVRNGYIDMNAGLTVGIDHNEQRVEVNVELQEGKQYRVKSVEISGLDSKAESLLRSLPQPGQIFDGSSTQQFFKENAQILPFGASLRDIMIESDPEEGTVAIVLDFRRCPVAQTANKGR